MSEKTTDEEMLFEHDPKGAFAQFVAPMAGYGVTMASFFRPTVTIDGELATASAIENPKEATDE